MANSVYSVQARVEIRSGCKFSELVVLGLSKIAINIDGDYIYRLF